MILVANTMGRLLLVRMQSPVNAEEVAKMTQQITVVVMAASSRLVGVTDLRGLSLLPVELTDLIVAMFRRNASRIDRSGLLLSDGALAWLQIDRVLRESQNAARRAFRDRFELEIWLGEVLTPLEKLEVHKFLAAPQEDVTAPASLRAELGETAPSVRRSSGRLGA